MFATILPARSALILLGLLSFKASLMTAQETVEQAGMVEAEQAATVQVGAYYYPWYKSPNEGGRLNWNRAMRLRLDPPQQPLLGLYDSASKAVIRAHIEQSERGGIDFWAVSWWGPKSAKSEAVFNSSILEELEGSRLKFAMLYESTGRFGSFENPSYRHWVKDLQFLRKHYFDHPNYLRIRGRPVLFVYLAREYFRNKGEQALADLREKFPEVYLVADDVFFESGEQRYQSDWARNFDAVTAYDIYGQSIKLFDGTTKAVDFLAENYAQAREAANSVGTAFMPAIAPGYNDTAVRDGNPGRARYFLDVEGSREGDIFRAMIRKAALPHLDPLADNIMMVTSFNEWYEDSQIEPTAGTEPASNKDDSESGERFTGGRTYHDYGFLYLDILRQEVGNR
jgi:hypothetical protein